MLNTNLIFSTTIPVNIIHIILMNYYLESLPLIYFENRSNILYEIMNGKFIY